jgi:hypothetical protein
VARLYTAEAILLGRISDIDWVPQSVNDFSRLQLNFANDCAEINSVRSGDDIGRVLVVQILPATG